MNKVTLSEKIVFIVLLLLLFFIPFIPGISYALSWYIHCINYSCEARAGGIAVYWSESGSGAVLPISIDQVNEIAQVANTTVEKIFSQSAEQSINTGRKQQGLDTNLKSSESTTMSKKQGLSLSKRFAASVKQDYTLMFLKYIADNHIPKDIPVVKRWLTAAEIIFDMYQRGTVLTHFYYFMLHNNLKDVSNIELERYITNARDNNEEVTDIAAYLYYERFPLHPGLTQNIDQSIVDVVKAFHQDDLIKAYRINPEGAFYKWLANKGELKDEVILPHIGYLRASMVGCQSEDKSPVKLRDCTLSEQFNADIKQLQKQEMIKKGILYTSILAVSMVAIVIVVRKRKLVFSVFGNIKSKFKKSEANKENKDKE